MGQQKFTIRGDWMRDGYIDNLNRERCLRIVVINGKPFDDCDDFGALIGELPISLTSDGSALHAWGEGVEFLPQTGELDRVSKLGVIFPIDP